MDKLLPIFLPVFFGLIAGFSHGIATDSMNLPNSLGEKVTQPFLGQALSD